VTDGPGESGVLVERGVDYGRGKLADVYWPERDTAAPLALLWHGIGTDERDVLGPLATAVSALGFSKGPAMSPIGNGPMTDLTEAAEAARPAETAAAAARPTPVPFHLVHGNRDTVVNIQQSRDFAVAAASRGWPVDLAETDTDHAGIVMTEYDESTRRCRPTTAPHAIAVGLFSAQTIASAAGRRG
jgi:predicted esterase